MEYLICNCKGADEQPTSANHVQSTDANSDTIIECTACGRFIKIPGVAPIPDIPNKTQEPPEQ